jgi:hypothetical protein
LFFSLDENVQSVASKKAFAQLLRVINLFVLGMGLSSFPSLVIEKGYLLSVNCNISLPLSEKQKHSHLYTLVYLHLKDMDLKKLITRLMNIIYASASKYSFTTIVVLPHFFVSNCCDQLLYEN